MDISFNTELVFAILTILISFFCGRISLVFSRGGIVDQDFFSLLLGLFTNFVWLVSLIWFWFEGNWLIPLIVVVVALFGTNTLVKPNNVILWSIRNILRVLTLFCALVMWHTHLL